ncbi:hypothetical protein DSM19430T_31370 [Desulfovibrio psychrotolerans]|uniref:Uncharacterized protein n=1 Tax=Desulfovibrio psychrotolerans TaxID=415242 RepID=A0A7J0BXP0_9BACT|nr:hypothetical protein DSM19430T_31370 [Desulfovibrio psychrotolerans]
MPCQTADASITGSKLKAGYLESCRSLAGSRWSDRTGLGELRTENSDQMVRTGIAGGGVSVRQWGLAFTRP